MAEEKKLMPCLLDREISSVEFDAFGHRHFAKALEGLIENSKNEPPYSIGLLGKWGTGKSSIKSLYLSSLKDDSKRVEKIHTITFNAWRCGGEDIKRALLRNVFLNIGGDELQLKDALFHQIEKTLTEKRKWKDILRDVFEKWIWSLPQLIIITFTYLIILISLYLILSKLQISNDWVKGFISVILFACGVPIIKFTFDLKHFLIPRSSNITRIEPPSTTNEEYEDLLIKQLIKYKAGGTILKEGKKCERLVVFIDDLDRLSAEEMVSGLDAVRAFMEIPKNQMPDGLGIVFVISCDEERVANALANRRQHVNISGLLNTGFSRSDARRFLDRIFQYRLEIPQFPKRDMRDYAMKRISELPEIVQDFKDRGVPLENIIDRMIHPGVQSPRNALQIVNAFVQSWWLARQRERDGAGTERPGGLQEGAVTNHPFSLAALCALRVDFPDFYSDLQQEPNLINRFTDVFIRSLPIEEQPESAKHLLYKYFDHQSNELKTDYRPLRQYIASLQGLRWPSTLLPLLLLSQDPVTRKYGDGAQRINDAFVSGDYQGVLVELGRDKDSRPLTSEDMRLLRELEEELHHETDVRQNHAAAVIAVLSNRFPKEQAHMLLSPLARRLTISPELRWRLGIEKIQDILPFITAEEQKDIAGRLIEDLLRTEGDITFRLESGQPPSYDEAVEMARQACLLVLWVRKRNGLDEQSDSAFLSWLEIRRVAIRSKEYIFPFSELETWMDENQEHLLSALGGRYTKLLAAQMESEQTQELKTDVVMGRSRSVFQSLWDAGEESRIELWDLLTRYVAVKMKEAVALAWELMRRYQKEPDSNALTSFIMSFANRLNKDMEDDKNWGLDWEDGALALLNIVEGRINDIGNEAQQALVALAISWSNVVETSAFSTCLVSTLQNINKTLTGEIIANWSGRILLDLPEPCINWLGNNFISGLNDEQRNQVTSYLQEMSQPNSVTEERGQHYQRFMSQLPEEAIKYGTIQSHLQNMFSQTARLLNNTDYLHIVFPVFPRLIKYGPLPQAGSMLHGLFINARNNPALFGWLHEQMAKYWPMQQAELSPYNPQQLFNDAQTFAAQYPNNEASYGIIYSMREMVQRGIVGEENIAHVIETACILWPYHQFHSLNTFLAFRQAPSPSRISELMDQINIQEKEEIDQLKKAWSHIVGILNDEQRVATTKFILGKTPKGTEQEPDLCLQIWLDLQKMHKADLLKKSVTDIELNDEQRKRIWLLISRTSQELGNDFFISVLPEVFKLQEIPETARTIFETKEDINKLFTSKEEQYDLGVTLLRCFITVTSQVIKNKFAAWMKDLKVGAVFRNLRKYEELTEDDLAILISFFPESKLLDKIQRKVG
ncbi:MAG: KAP family P-loop domain protein [Pelotomaculum sp. PtaB.Bin013]|uniref:KAP family NTPase n=1 Tax=Pelotomaculum isophthalicicum JI TaxID=947010 RepID=A0A9X4H858_9FIRM|nr:P-loop NTPase fold protein [Pelotomaculum isophthalicicum]MDF9408524.1 KAP family NTPase [Pelotomaculum isophthalicicum JI]OPX92059.1 MAG: KAP family P-loop domain protein [Pelotomaculum sp. PtaB.Bin013]